MRVETAEPLKTDRWQHVVVTYDGSRVAAGVKVYVDGQPVQLRVLVDELNQHFRCERTAARHWRRRPWTALFRQARRIASLWSSLVGRGSRVAGNAFSDRRHCRFTCDERTPAQARKLAACFLDQHAPPPIADVRSELLQLEQQKLKLEQSIPTTMVMQEMPEPRATFVLSRGEYDKPTERVSPGVPGSLTWPGQPPIRNRLDFARWLVAPENPLTARVTVNRIWQLYFGQGLVKTVNDFGSQGERPSHPELLDYLATEFVASGWNLKLLHKSIVMSATYRQSSRNTPELRVAIPTTACSPGDLGCACRQK